MSQDEQFKVTDRRRRSADAPPTTAPSPEPSASGQRRTGAPPAELSALFIMFANAALMSLGAVTEPGAEAPRVELDQARSAIDVLLMLRDKTQGNRTEQESRLLEGILYDLQMRYVQAARAGA